MMYRIKMPVFGLVIFIIATPGVFLRAEEAVPGWHLPGDTPEKAAHPEEMLEKIQKLREIKPWTDYATPEEQALYEGPETEWPMLPASAYSLEGFDRSLLGGEVPEPGVHPRILFNFEDLPAIRARLLSTEQGRKKLEVTGTILQNTMLNPETDDGKAFLLLSEGRLGGLTFMDPYKGANGNHRFQAFPKFGIYPAHVCYWPRNLHALAFYALMKDDEDLIRRTASAVFNYYKLREPLIDRQNARAEDPNADDAWPGDVWRSMHYVAGESHLGFAYDLTARYMTEAQKDLMRRVIVKATAGKRSYGANAPIRWRDTNWVGWDTQHFLTHLAIEGEPGYEPEIYASGRDTVYGYLTYGINANGSIFETNGKNGAGLHFALTSAVALARRGDNMLGHPHLRKLTAAQVQQTVPDKTMNVNNGTYGCANFDGAGFMKNFYPGDAAANWLLSTTHNRGVPMPKAESWQRTHPLTSDGYLGFASYTPPAAAPEGAIWYRAHLNLPLDMADDLHGQLNTRSSNDKDAAFLMMEARPDLYYGGHQQHDAGHFYFSALGVNWAIESDHGLRDSRVHNVVLIDGKGQGESQHLSPAKVEWLGAVKTEDAAFASADLSNGYAALWSSPMHYSWYHEDKEAVETWQVETDPEVVKVFKGTQHWKCRIWDHSYWERPWGPTMRGTYNPVQYAYRSTGLVRGEKPYAVIVDSIRKDDDSRIYTWQMQVNRSMKLVTLENGMQALDPGGEAPGEPLLLLVNGSPEAGNEAFVLEEGEIPIGRSPTLYRRISLQREGQEAWFRIVLIPHRRGEALPVVQVRDDRVHIQFAGAGSDLLAFSRDAENRPDLRVQREGKGEILSSVRPTN